MPQSSVSRAPRAACFVLCTSLLGAQSVPHNQDRPPGPPLSPAEAQERFQLPEGFRVELVASEPDLVNPIKMCFDARGRIWLVESLEYPRSSAGEGRDRIRVLEDKDGDGKIESFSVFAEGLNVPCGIALGYGGVFVTNSPDILFLKDTDGDDRADTREVVLTGFGRHDTHELPNSLAWGPDGWLYGLNGVFNPAEVRQKGRKYNFTCALWRYHPRTRDFELFAEGTSNPWGLGFDGEGAAFVEACVIDHLFHLTETGYYHRQGGPYPPYTWKIESIVKHRNYKAAYCALDFYDADVYPEPYRGRVYYGNIHGSCINSDELTRDGSTYFAKPAPAILKTEDVWFMPVDIDLAPDGCFYVLDWYDRYHCYQDARRDSDGIDRLKGRLWRIAYGEAPRPRGFDLEKEASEALVGRLAAPNRWWRDESRRILSERRDPDSLVPLRALVLDEAAPRHARMQALWTLGGVEDPASAPRALETNFHLRVLALADSGLRAWGVRLAGNLRQVDGAVRQRVGALAADPNPDVRLQVAIAAPKLLGDGALPLLLEVLAASPDDVLMPKIVWRNLEPLLEEHGGDFVAWLKQSDAVRLAAVEPIAGRALERLLGRRAGDSAAVAGLVAVVLERPGASGKAAVELLEVLGRVVSSGELRGEMLDAMRTQLSGVVAAVTRRGRGDPLYLRVMTLAAAWKDPGAAGVCRALVEDAAESPEVRAQALRALSGGGDPGVAEFARRALAAPDSLPRPLIAEVFSVLGRLESPEVADWILGSYAKLAPDVRPQAVDLLAQRPAWAHRLLDRVASKTIEARSLNVTQVRRLLAHKNEKLAGRVRETWGTLREERSSGREEVIARMKKVLAAAEGDPWSGQAVFDRVCAQCHVLFGRGNAVGPDITVNGRETLDLLLSNLLDPNLVIGKDYYARSVVTTDGRVLNGLLVEDSPQRVALKVAGGKEEVVARRDVASLAVSPVSLMPEDLEKTVTEAELRDLVRFLRYDEAPPAPIEPVVRARVAEARIDLSQRYGQVTVRARFPGDGDLREVLDFQHSGDARPFIHPLRAPGGGPVLTALRPGDHPWQYGVFTGHARVGGVDFWHEKGWIRSRGLTALAAEADRIVIGSRSDWLSERRGGERLLVEDATITVHAPTEADRYVVDFDWTLTAGRDLELGRYDYGGLAYRPAAHGERQHARPSEAERRPWQAMSGRFQSGRAQGAASVAVDAGVVIFDHPQNPGFPNAWRVDGEGLINPAITAGGPLALKRGVPVTFRHRLLVHLGQGSAALIAPEYERWAAAKAPAAGGP